MIKEKKAPFWQVSLLILLILVSFIFMLRFVFGGDEDTWLCTNGRWQAHGKPSRPMPQTACP